MKILLGIFKGLAYIVYGLILISILLVAPMVAGYQPVMVISGSMEPSYPVGSITYYKEADFADIGVGDVITFDLGETSLATHRVVEVDQTAQAFTTKGDNNETNDVNPVAYSKIQGKVLGFAIPYAGYFMAYAKTLYVIIPCVGILIIDLLLTPKDKPKKAETTPE